MADDVLVDNGENTDYTVSTDEGVGGHVQRVKLAYSADGSETHVPADADGLLVNLGSNNDVSVSGSVAVTDNSGSLTVDAPVGTPVFVRLSDGSSAITTLPVKESRGATGTLTTVADTASSTSILASNSNRIRATITNDSSARLYLRFEAAAASTSNYAVSLAQHETWVEDQYTGEIRGIWASDPGDGAARVTEVTA